MTTLLTQQPSLDYPDSDGQPMADNTLQFRWIVTIKENLEIWFAQDPNVFVAGDLLWYPVEGEPTIRRAPDVLVALGRPKGERGSYKQWMEENCPPQVVFEILSPGNTLREMGQKWEFYNRYGVLEYYIYDPDRNDLGIWQRQEHQLPGPLQSVEDLETWVSPHLGIRFQLTSETLTIFRPDGQPFLTSQELAAQAEAARQLATQETLRADREKERADQAEAKAERMAATLRALGLDPE